MYGMPTLIELPDIEDCAALCARLGLSFVEINMNLPQYQTQTMPVERMLRAKDRLGVGYTLHLDENLDVCAFNGPVAEAYVDTVMRSIDIAQQMGMPVINMHMAMGVYFTLPHKRVYLYDIEMDAYVAKIVDFRRRCEDKLAGGGVKICIENTGPFTGAARRGIDELLKSAAFGLTLDVGHDYLAGGVDEGFMLARRDRLAHMHLHDSTARETHLALGDGETDIGRFLCLAKSAGIRCVLETKTVDGLRRSVRALGRYDADFGAWQ